MTHYASSKFGRVDNLKVCHHCSRKASQWILLAPLMTKFPEVFHVHCHQHRIKAKDLPEGARFVTRDELRVRDVMFE